MRISDWSSDVCSSDLLPFALLPLLGVSTPSDVAASYYSPILFLVLGGALMALAIGRTGLHRRLALAIVGRAPASPRALLLAFMVATAMLSMIVSKPATTLLMIPGVVTILTDPGSPEGERHPLPLTPTLRGAYATPTRPPG